MTLPSAALKAGSKSAVGASLKVNPVRRSRQTRPAALRVVAPFCFPVCLLFFMEEIRERSRNLSENPQKFWLESNAYRR